MAGYISHIIIDLLNKKNVQVFFPIGKGFCFGLCYANKLGNKVLMYGGLGISILLLLYGFIA